MKRLVLGVLGIAAIASVAFGGSETYSGKEIKQVAPAPCPEWYADQEFNVGLWGTYVFTQNDWQDDRYIQADHAWGGGIDLKYFFHRYFGIGIEGWAVDARQSHQDIVYDVTEGFFEQRNFHHENNAIGAVLGTLTLRYPIPCTRFSPYIFGGGGVIFGGGQRHDLVFSTAPDGDLIATTHDTDSTTEGIGQVGGGLEIRFTPHIGWISDFSWNFVNGPENNFGMVRTGINFAF